MFTVRRVHMWLELPCCIAAIAFYVSWTFFFWFQQRIFGQHMVIYDKRIKTTYIYQTISQRFEKWTHSLRTICEVQNIRRLTISIIIHATYLQQIYKNAASLLSNRHVGLVYVEQRHVVQCGYGTSNVFAEPGTDIYQLQTNIYRNNVGPDICTANDTYYTLFSKLQA